MRGSRKAAGFDPPPPWPDADSAIVTVAASCPHELMLSQVKVPVLLTHHARHVFAETGNLFGAMSDLQAAKARELVAAAGAPIGYVSLPDAAHAMHAADAPRFVKVVTDWAKTLPA